MTQEMIVDFGKLEDFKNLDFAKIDKIIICVMEFGFYCVWKNLNGNGRSTILLHRDGFSDAWTAISEKYNFEWSKKEYNQFSMITTYTWEKD